MLREDQGWMRAGTCAACEQKARHAERVPRATVARSPPWQGPRDRDQRAQRLSCALSEKFEGEVYGSIYAGANNRCNEKKSKTCVTRRIALVARDPIDSKRMVLHAAFDEAPDGRKKGRQVTGDEEGRRGGRRAAGSQQEARNEQRGTQGAHNGARPAVHVNPLLAMVPQLLTLSSPGERRADSLTTLYFYYLCSISYILHCI
jgi:hypothetical protein